MSVPAKAGAKSPAVNIKKAAYAMATTDGQSAEVTMYGDIYEQQPTDWWGDPVEGQFILLDEFMDDLERIAGCSEITIRMNSYGGDAGVSNTIHNRLRELARAGAHLTCIVDGVAMSGGSLIMCACDTVKVNPSSLVMIHKCWTFLFGGYNADELREQATNQDAWDKMQVEIYKRKTGLTDTVLSHMMSDTTYMTGREAVSKGFADELMEDSEPAQIAASADGRRLFVNGRTLHLAPGMFAPDSIPTVKSGGEPPAETHKNSPDEPGSKEGGDHPMAKTLEELRAEFPELTAQLEAEAKAAAVSGAAGDIEAERKRLQEIDALASVIDPALVQEAKYGEKACSAQELTYRAAKAAAENGQTFLAQMQADNQASGAQSVGAAHDPGEEPPKEAQTPDQRMESARAEVKALFGKKKED